MLKDKAEEKVRLPVNDINELLETKRDVISWNKAYDIAYTALI